MPVLADTPELAARVATAVAATATTAPPAPPAAAADAPARVPDDIARTWALLNPDTPAFAAGAGEGWVLVRSEASASQYLAMQQHLAAGGALPDGVAVVALRGQRFVGQRGRSWQALEGNLHLSLHQRLDLSASEAQVPLALLPAVATARAIERASHGALVPRTKWVNDLLMDGRKVAGVLSATSVHGGRVGSALYGIGVNVAQAPALVSAARVPRPGALAHHHPAFESPDAWAALLGIVLQELEAARNALLEGRGATLLDDYRARAAFVGKRVTIWPVDDDSDAAQPLARGVVVRLNDDLSLTLAGVPEPLRHGRMTIDG
jgi:biotin-(acetyl-CoA carboxylase) ligase